MSSDSFAPLGAAAPKWGGMTPAALGFRAHSGWAAMVVVAGSPRSPTLIDRRRIELVEPGIPKQPYHAAEKLDLPEARELVKVCARRAESLARKAFRAAIDELRKRGQRVVGCGVLLASGRPATTLEATLASHALIHTAEGELFRQALIRASKQLRLRVTGVKERELFALGEVTLRVRSDELRARLTGLGQSIGPPWRQDEKYAALVGWLALAAASKR